MRGAVPRRAPGCFAAPGCGAGAHAVRPACPGYGVLRDAPRAIQRAPQAAPSCSVGSQHASPASVAACLPLSMLGPLLSPPSPHLPSPLRSPMLSLPLPLLNTPSRPSPAPRRRGVRLWADAQRPHRHAGAVLRPSGPEEAAFQAGLQPLHRALHGDLQVGWGGVGGGGQGGAWG